jgi:NitT/TauT family transport system substrate-binding protein
MIEKNHVLRVLTGLFLLIGAIVPTLAAEKILFMIDWLPAGDKAVPYLGVQAGLFAAEGLDVTIQSGRGSSDVVTKLGTGAADMGTGGLAALLQARAEAPVPVKAIASIYTIQPDALFTTETSGISSIKDVVGKTIATATFSSSNVAWPLVLKANGVDAAKVDLLKADPGALAPMLASGKVAATINWITVAPAFEHPLAESGKKLKLIMWSDYGFEGVRAVGVRVGKNIEGAPGDREKIHARLRQGDADGDRRSARCGQGRARHGA